MSTPAVPSYAASAKEAWQKRSDVLAAGEPPEARGLSRDGVRLMVSRASGDLITHARFRHLPDYLERGDVVVVNTSATINASLDAWRGETGEPVELHLSTPVPGGSEDQWVVELRRPAGDGTTPLLTARSGESLRLTGGGTATLVGPYLPGCRHARGRRCDSGWPSLSRARRRAGVMPRSTARRSAMPT